MKAYYSDALTTLYHGDCLSYLPALAFDALITDPPYGVRERTKRLSNGRSNKTASIDYPAIVGDDAPFDPSPFLAYKKVVLFGGNYFADRLPPTGGWIVWDNKDGTTPDDNADCELAWTNIKTPARIFRHLWRGMIKASERDQKRVHPAQKPVALMEWIINKWTNEGDVVCDPYMGGGSTGIACVRTGRKFIGVEISEEYCAIAKQRIQDAQACTPQALRDAGESLPSIARKLKVSVPEVARMLRGAV